MNEILTAVVMYGFYLFATKNHTVAAALAIMWIAGVNVLG